MFLRHFKKIITTYGGVREASGAAGLPAPHAVKVGALLVLASGLDGVALRARLREDLLAVISGHFFGSFLFF